MVLIEGLTPKFSAGFFIPFSVIFFVIFTWDARAAVTLSPSGCGALLAGSDTNLFADVGASENPAMAFVQAYLSLLPPDLSPNELQKLLADPFQPPCWPDGGSQVNQGRAFAALTKAIYPTFPDLQKKEVLGRIAQALQLKIETQSTGMRERIIQTQARARLPEFKTYSAQGITSNGIYPSSDGSKIVILAANRAYLFETEGGRLIFSYLLPMTSAAKILGYLTSAIHLSHSDTLFLKVENAIEKKSVVIKYDPILGAKEAELTFPGHYELRLSPDEKLLAAFDNNLLLIFDRGLNVLYRTEQKIQDFQFTSSSVPRWIDAGATGSYRLFELRPVAPHGIWHRFGQWLNRYPKVQVVEVDGYETDQIVGQAGRFSFDASKIVSTDRHGSILVLDLSSHRISRLPEKLELPSPKLIFSRDGEFLLAKFKHHFSVWSLRTLQQVLSADIGDLTFNEIAISAQGRYVAAITSSRLHQLAIWDLESKGRLDLEYIDYRTLEFSHDQQFLFVTTANAEWSPGEGKRFDLNLLFDGAPLSPNADIRP